VLLNYDVTVAEELAVKWFEMIQLGLPSTALSAFVGPVNLLVKREFGEMDKLLRVYLPHVLQNGRGSRFFLNIYYERHFDTDLNELRA
jgi:ubiquinone biosynthesis protein COQ4